MSMIDSHLTVQVSIDEMKQHLPIYLQRVEAGETLVIVRAGRPIAEIKPVVSPSKRLRPFGLCARKFTVPDDFDEPLPENIIQGFEEKRSYF